MCGLPLVLLTPRPQEPDEALQSIDQGPGKASPSFQDMRNAQASWAGKVGPEAGGWLLMPCSTLLYSKACSN